MAPLTLSFTEAVEPETQATIAELFASWDQALFGDGEVRLRPLLGGANNRNFIVECASGKYALRVANPLAERLAVDRASALSAQEDAASAGVSPQVLASRLPQGHQLSEFVEGTVLGPRNLHETAILRQVGECLARLHAAPTRARAFSPLEDIEVWNGYSRQDGIELSAAYLELVDTAKQVQALVDSLPLPEVFCHNDTVPQNFIAAPDGVRLVDWDYSGRGLACFELGSFVCTADLSREETGELLAGYGIAASEPVLARIGLMSFVAAVREIAWVTMAAPLLAGSTDVTHEWYVEYMTANSDRARELRRSSCTPTHFDAASSFADGSTV